MKQKTIFIFTFALLAAVFACTGTEQTLSPQTNSDLSRLSNDLGNSSSLESDNLNVGSVRGPDICCKRGRRGPRGHRGKHGHTGETGEPGAAGSQGEPGPAGTQGEAGPQGEIGSQGEPGPAGEMGPIGETGPAGAQGEQGPQGETGSQGEPGPAGSITQNAISIYSSNYNTGCELDCDNCYVNLQALTPLYPGQTAISFGSENTNLGDNIEFADSEIWVWTNGTYLISVSGIVQEPGREGDNTQLSFTVGLHEQQGETGACSLVNPFPLGEYGIEIPNEGGFIICQTFNILQMVKVTSAGDQPVIFKVLLNNLSGFNIFLTNPVLNIMQID